MTLKEFLIKNEMTTDQFSIAHGFNLRTVQRWKQGRPPHPNTARLIEKITNHAVTYKDLMRNDGKKIF